MKPDDLPLLVKIELAKKLTGLGETTLRNMCRTGRIKARQSGFSGTWRIRRDEFIRFIKEELGLELADFADPVDSAEA